MSKTEAPRENLILNLVCNLLLPILILNKLSAPWGAGRALLLALAFPFGYGTWEFVRRKKTNVFSVLGLLNTLITGGLAWLGITGIWFAVKEAAFPVLVGLFVLYSATTSKPAVEFLFLNPTLFHLDRLKERIAEIKMESEFHRLLVLATRWLALSFFFSGTLNFILATRIFLPLPHELDEAARSVRLNEQIAEMHQWSFMVILAPSMIFLMTIFYVIINRLKKMTGFTDDDLFKVN